MSVGQGRSNPDLPDVVLAARTKVRARELTHKSALHMQVTTEKSLNPREVNTLTRILAPWPFPVVSGCAHHGDFCVAACRVAGIGVGLMAPPKFRNLVKVKINKIENGTRSAGDMVQSRALEWDKPGKVGAQFGIGRTSVLRLWAEGKIKSAKVGRCRLVSVSSLRAYIEACVENPTRKEPRA